MAGIRAQAGEVLPFQPSSLTLKSASLQSSFPFSVKFLLSASLHPPTRKILYSGDFRLRTGSQENRTPKLALGFPRHHSNWSRKGRASLSCVRPAACAKPLSAGARTLRLQLVLYLRDGTGFGFHADGHVNLNLHRPPHPAAAAPARPAAGPREPRRPRLSHSAPRQAPPRLAAETGGRAAH